MGPYTTADATVAELHTLATASALRAKSLRFVLINELMAHPTRTIAQLVATLEAYGYTLPGRASKVISDALRWEVRRGRVQRLGRGLYRYQSAPPVHGPPDPAVRRRMSPMDCRYNAERTTTTQPPALPQALRPHRRTHPLAPLGRPPLALDPLTSLPPHQNRSSHQHSLELPV